LAYNINLKRHETEVKKLELQTQLDETLIKLLSGFMGICCVCKKVRVEDKQTESKEWQDVDHYITEQTNLKFSHGYCPDCELKAMEEIEKKFDQ